MTQASTDETQRRRVQRAYDRYGEVLYRYATMIIADPALAEDIVQDVFLRFLRVRREVTASEEAYLRTAVRNECYSRLRRRRHERAWRNHAQILAECRDEPDRDLRLALEAGIRTLPPEQREVLYLRVYEGLTFRQIAAAVGEQLNTVASRYRYAIDHMRQRLVGEDR